MRLYNIAYWLRDDERFANPAVGKNLRSILGMVLRHLPSQPRLRCGYLPFHDINDISLRQIVDELTALTIPQKGKRPRRNSTDYTFPPESVSIIQEITVDIATLLIDERLMGYIAVSLKRLFRLRIWKDSSFSSMTCAELAHVISNAPENSHSSLLNNTLYQATQKLGVDVTVLVEWIRIFSVSQTSSTEPFILNVIDDHDIHALSSRVFADEGALRFFDNFYPPEKLLPYQVALTWFRELWFDGRVTLYAGSLTEEAFEWLQKHPRKKKKGWLDGIRWRKREILSPQSVLNVL
jgi:hypothetical protein